MLQIEFTSFPGYDAFSDDGWPHLTCPWRRVSEDDDEAIQDAAMALVDWAVDGHPEMFGMEDVDDYEPFNDMTIDLAGRISNACAGHGRQPFADSRAPHCRWVSDVKLTDDITVRVAHFERPRR